MPNRHRAATTPWSPCSLWVERASCYAGAIQRALASSPFAQRVAAEPGTSVIIDQRRLDGYAWKADSLTGYPHGTAPHPLHPPRVHPLASICGRPKHGRCLVTGTHHTLRIGRLRCALLLASHPGGVVVAREPKSDYCSKMAPVETVESSGPSMWDAASHNEIPKEHWYVAPIPGACPPAPLQSPHSRWILGFPHASGVETVFSAKCT